MTDQSWIKEARKLMGVHEIKGSNHHPEIVQLGKDIKRGGIKDDETRGVLLSWGPCLNGAASDPVVSSQHGLT